VYDASSRFGSSFYRKQGFINGPCDAQRELPLCGQRSAPLSRLENRDLADDKTCEASPLELEGLPVDSLTERVRSIAITRPSALDDDPSYAKFFEKLCRCLHRSGPRHVLLLRERGVGEQAALIELARQALDSRLEFLRKKQFITMDCRHLAFEELRGVMQAIFDKLGGNEHVVLCIEGIVNLLRDRGFTDHRSIFRSLLVRARCRVIGILSPHEYEEQIAIDPELNDLFSIVTLEEPQPPVARKLVRHYASGLEVQYRLRIDEEAIDRAVSLASSYILHERLPYKAVKVLRSICDDVEYDRSQQGAERDRVTEADVVAKIAEISGIPASTLSGVGEAVDYEKSFSDFIIGQEHAVHEVATELGLIKAGLIDAGKPASVIMFIGQTGTGKTELAKVLARFHSSSKRLKTFTLGNFSEPHSVSGIIGVPPGYVGHDQGGRLVNELNADPYGVFLLDEADKAHPDVMQPFLNLFDEGWICDQRGVKAHADRAIFILTTNVGQRQIADMCKSGKSIEEITSTMKESLSKIRHTKSNRPVFTPEFLARIKRFIVFRSLDAAAMQGICRKLVADLQSQWRHKRQKELRIPDSIVAAMGQKAFELDDQSQGKEGGRIVRKLIADLVESRIQAAIAKDPTRYQGSKIVSVRHEQAEVVTNQWPIQASISFDQD
jgi:ATP-dependent Clp protease ATP-binding subunit ClpC